MSGILRPLRRVYNSWWHRGSLSALACLLPSTAHAAVLFSEYIDPASGNDKALEIFSSTAFDLATNNCFLKFYFNGNTSAGQTLALSGSLAAGDVYVIVPTNATATLQALANQSVGSTWFNGDDAIELVCNGSTLDVIGQIGLDPGTEWGSGDISTADATIRRRALITSGDPNGSNSFDPSLEWIGGAITYDGLGAPGEGSFLPVASVECNDAQTIAIGSVQGTGAPSPLEGNTVVIQGSVVGDFEGSTGMQGFFVQDAGDGNVLSSDGIFVYHPGSFIVGLGATVAVKGEVEEFFDRTQIKATAVKTCGTAALPVTTPLPIPKAAPSGGVDAWERYEGMRVAPDTSVVVTEHFQLLRFGQFAVSAGTRLIQSTEAAAPGAAATAHEASNALNYLFVEDGSNTQDVFPTAFPAPGLSASNTLRAGTRVDNLIGPLDYSFGHYRIRPTQNPTFTNLNPRSATAPSAGGGSLRIATFNVLNYFTTLDTGSPICGPDHNLDCRGANSASELSRQRDKLIPALLRLRADILALEELENNYVPFSSSALQDLSNRLNAAAGAGDCPHYTAVDPGTFVGGDAIAVGLLYCDDTVTLAAGSTPSILDDRDVPGLGLGTSVTLPIFNGVNTNRAVLAATFMIANQPLTVAVSHMKSKSVTASFEDECNGWSTDLNCDQGDGQGYWNQRRVHGSRALVAWLHTNPTGANSGERLVLGDMNAYTKEDPVKVFTDLGYRDLKSHFGGQPSYAFDGRWGSLDHALASPALLAKVTGADCDRSHADEPLALDYNLEFKSAAAQSGLYAPDEFRASDHNPIVVGIDPEAAEVPAAGGLAWCGLSLGFVAFTRRRLR